MALATIATAVLAWPNTWECTAPFSGRSSKLSLRGVALIAIRFVPPLCVIIGRAASVQPLIARSPCPWRR